MSKHTPEPWIFVNKDGGFSYIDEIDKKGDGLIATTWINNEANSARIVDCVNACEGIDDPMELRKQRDELLEALEIIADGPWHDGIDSPEAQVLFDEQIARAAIAKCKATP